ncbi:MAG TPA: hypothetical protein VFU22_28715 [Roseiflexaceae bacterium]|nr:hypothetical protein [Roseiflexaceae bacterium]
MDDQPRSDNSDSLELPAAPAFDKEAARRRYRATMRGPYMRSMYVLLALVILAAWGLGIGAAFARDVERLPNHDLTVPPSRCVTCHAQPSSGAPIMPHVTFPSCGFCHRQGPPGEN